MIRRIQLYAVLNFTFLLSFCAVTACQEVTQQQQLQMTDDIIEIFEVSQDFEEPDMNLKIVCTKKFVFSLSDVPFYTKVFCSYVYEEKLKKWYLAVIGYANSLK